MVASEHRSYVRTEIWGLNNKGVQFVGIRQRHDERPEEVSALVFRLEEAKQVLEALQEWIAQQEGK